MTTNWQSLRSTFKTIGLLTGTFWRRLTEPDETVPEPERRRQGRLLAGMLVTIIPVGIWIYFDTLSDILAVLDLATAFRERPILSIVPIALVIFGVAYGLSRGKYYVWGALIFLVNLYVADFMAVANAATPAAVVGILSYLSLCILIGSLFLPLWGTIILHIACLSGIYLLPVFSVPAAVAYPDSITPAFNTILVIGTVIVVTAAMRQQDLRQIRQQAQELVETTLDIARRKQAAETLAEERNLLRTLIDNIPDDIFVKDTESRFIVNNVAHMRSLGISSQKELVGKVDADFVAPEMAERHYANEQEIVRSAQPLIDLEEMVVDPDGKEKWFLTTKVPLRDIEGEVVGLVGISRDITERVRVGNALQKAHHELEMRVEERTEELIKANETLRVEIAERKQAEEALRQSNRRLEKTLVELEATREKVIQQERLAVVGQLAVGIAHEFNNILAATALYTEMSLREPELPSKIRKRLNVIAQQTRHATDLVQQIVDFGQRAVLDRKTVDVAALLEETVALLERTLPRNIQIELTRKCTTPVTINGDPKRVRQAVVNLALNARDAMSEGGQLRIELERVWIEEGKEPPLPEMPAGEWIQVTVTDTGTGIPPDVLPHIYEPFFTTRAPLGHGLGLAQVYGIVRQHNGYIHVETQTGKGTTFTIYLPAESSSPSKTPSLATPAWDLSKSGTILVVEDDAALRAALVDCLQMFNYQTLEASSGREALSILKEREDAPLPDSERNISLVLSNWMMPGMSGLELAWGLKQHYPDVKALILTDHPLDRPSKDTMPDNIIDWLQRPVDLERLAQLLRDILSEK